jgi:hypothetical protein
MPITETEGPTELPTVGPTEMPTPLDLTVDPTITPSSGMVVTEQPTIAPSFLPTLLPTLVTNVPTTTSSVNNETLVAVKTNIVLELIGMTSLMDEVASNVFQESCALFLEEFLINAEPTIVSIKCTIIDQEVLVSSSSSTRQRRLQTLFAKSLKNKKVTRQEGESSLIVTVTVEGSANPASSTGVVASDELFKSQVIDVIVKHSAQFAEQVREGGIEAGITAFDTLTSIELYEASGEENEPTLSPTFSPTYLLNPTASPMANTTSPTELDSPTQLPTLSPSLSPEVKPTHKPTTHKPTTSTPTHTPTLTPTTVSPTKTPTALPTNIPTAVPTPPPLAAPT